MGGGLSAEEEQHYVSDFYQLAQASQMLPDIGIDDSIMKFSGLDSVSVLDGYSAQLINDLGSKSPDYVKDLGSAISAFNYVPNAVGLGALIISFVLDVTISGLKKVGSENYITGMMRRVFAEEKASGVRDAMDEYMKRFRFNMNKPEALLDDTKRIETQLSDGLTRLKNSMLKDNQMNSRSMKHWTNGAAFHLQMVIHVARMEMAKDPEAKLNEHVLSISNLADHYKDELQKLLENYENYKRSTIYTDLTSMRCATLYGTVCWYVNCGVFDTELNLKFSTDNEPSGPECRSLKNPYLDYMFNNWNQPKELREYFPEVKRKLREVIMQHSAYNIQKFLPGSKKKK